MDALAPPGTEEDCQEVTTDISSGIISKKNSETDRLLSLRFLLPGGGYGNVFERSIQNGSELWYCNVCKCPVMGQVFNHEAGKRHCSSLENASNRNRGGCIGGGSDSNMKNTRDEKLGKTVEDMIKIAPGEPVPPGFENEITKVAKIQEKLDSFKKSSLVGLEYLLELQDYDQDREPSYLCLLCGKKGDIRTIIPHLVSYRHLQCFLQRHFPKTFNALMPFSSHRKYKKCWQDVVTKIADAIETKYGRLRPYPVDVETYEQTKSSIFAMIHNGPHFSEANGYSFEHLVDKAEILRLSNELICDDNKTTDNNSTHNTSSPNAVLNAIERQDPYRRKSPQGSTTSSTAAGSGKNANRHLTRQRSGRRRSLSSVSSISSDDFDAFDNESRTHIQRPYTSSRPSYDRGTYDRNLFNRRRRSRSRSRTRSPGRSRRDSLPWHQPDYMRKDKDKSDERKPETKREEFRRLASAIETDMERQLRQHQLNPEKHPQYNEEWKVFWNKRYKELQQEGQDTINYDFKPDWIVYWNKRMEELHKMDVKIKIDALRKRLGLPEITPISFKINSTSTIVGRKRMPGGGKPAPVAAQPDQDHEVIVIDDKERSHSPWEAEVPNRRRSPGPDYRRRRGTRSRSRSRSRQRYARRSRSRSSGRTYRRSRSSSRSRRSYSRHRRSRTKSPISKRSSNATTTSTSRRDDNWQRNLYAHKKDVVMVRESTLKKQMELDEQVNEISVGDVNVVAILRLLTALEDKLGSLGPKVVDLLTTALALEKKEPNSSETLLDDEANCVLFETIKEKLKGLLHAELIAFGQEKAIKTAITKIAHLIHLANTRKTEKAKVDVLKNIDKAAIAKQISTALVLQGKTDVTQDELEQLINVVVSMAEVSKSKKAPITTASFLKMLEHKEPTEVDLDASKSEGDGKEKDKDAMDGLSDLELQTLLQSFKDLSAEEQHGLISYLKKLEAKEPARVETLRKFVNIDNRQALQQTPTKLIDSRPEPVPSVSPFSMKLSMDKTKNVDKKRIDLDDDDEDYSFEDVFKAASKNVQLNENAANAKQEKNTVENVSNLIANIMVSIASKTPPSSSNPLASMAKLNANTSTSSQMQIPEHSQSYSMKSNNQFQPNYSANYSDSYNSFNPRANPNPNLNAFYPPGNNNTHQQMQHQPSSIHKPQQQHLNNMNAAMMRMPNSNMNMSMNNSNMGPNNGNNNMRNNYYRW